MRARLVDVAKEAGVSPKTVSNYINDYPFMTPETSERVRRAIAKLGYVPNRLARNLRTGRTGNIALVLPELTSPYFAELAILINRAAEKRGYTVLIDQTGGDPVREQRAVAGLTQNSIDGLIVSPVAHTGTVLAAAATRPLVLLGERAHPDDVPYVGVDNIAAARAATEHLLGLGRRRIAAIGPVPDRPGGTWVPRLDGYRAAITEAGLESDDSLQPSIDSLNRPGGRDAMQRLLDLDQPPDAVFCFTDPIAVGALSVLHAHGVRVPDDIAIIGWDDTQEAAFTWPPLSTVAMDKTRIAEVAVEQLLRALDSETVDDPITLVDFEILARASTLGE